MYETRNETVQRTNRRTVASQNDRGLLLGQRPHVTPDRYAANVEDTWSSRDLPVLEAAVSMLDEPGHYFVAVHEIAERTGLDKTEVARALDALEGPYIADYQRLISGGDPTNWHVDRVTEAARRAVGQWPTPESLVDRLVQGLNEAAEHDTDSARKRRLREAATVLGETARGVVTEVVAKVIVHASHMG